jgi:hypothetical protein
MNEEDLTGLDPVAPVEEGPGAVSAVRQAKPRALDRVLPPRTREGLGRLQPERTLGREGLTEGRAAVIGDPVFDRREGRAEPIHWRAPALGLHELSEPLLELMADAGVGAGGLD